jgi:hypothetical protein
MASWLSPRIICFQVGHTECPHSIREVVTRDNKVEVLACNLSTVANKYSSRHLPVQYEMRIYWCNRRFPAAALCLGGSLQRVRGQARDKVTLLLAFPLYTSGPLSYDPLGSQPGPSATHRACGGVRVYGS